MSGTITDPNATDPSQPVQPAPVPRQTVNLPYYTPPPASNLFGDNWARNLMLLGGDMASAGNARVNGGFLANPGLSAFAVGLRDAVLDSQKADQSNAVLQNTLADVASRQATTQKTQAETETEKSKPAYYQGLTNEANAAAGLSSAQTPGAAADSQSKLLNLRFQQQSLPMRLKLLDTMNEQEPGGATNGPPGVAAPSPGTPTPGAGTPPPGAGAQPQKTSMRPPAIVSPDLRDGMLDQAVASLPAGTPDSVRQAIKTILGSQVQIESGWNANAENGTTGAFGLGGLLPSTVRKPGYGVAGVDAPESMFDPQRNLNFAAQYLYGRGNALGMTDDDWLGQTPMAQARLIATLGAYGGVKQGSPNTYAMRVLKGVADAHGMPMPLASAQAAAPDGQGTDPNAAPGADTAPGLAPNQRNRGVQIASADPSFMPATSSSDGTAPPPSTKDQPPTQVADASPAAPAPAPGTTAPAPGNAAPAPTTTGSAPESPSSVPLPKGYVDPQLALQKADFYDRKAFAAKTLGMDGSAFAETARQWRSYALDVIKQGAAPVNLRGEGSVYLRPGEAPIQTEIVKTLVGPDFRKYTVQFPTINAGQPLQHVAGQPDWVPPGGRVIGVEALSPTEEATQKEAANDLFGKEGKDEFDAAQRSLFTLSHMQPQIDAFNGNPSFWNSGKFETEKAALASSINAIATSIFGFAPPFDPNKVGAYETWMKDMKTGGIQTSRSLGAHEAASVVNMVMSAQPNPENSPRGAQMVKDGLEEAARRIIDLHNFVVSWKSNPNAYGVQHNPNDLTAAEAMFNQMYSPAKYAQRALSNTNPVAVKSPDDAKRLLPGTYIRLPDGSRGQVPYGDQYTPDGTLKLDLAPYAGTGVTNGR